MERKGSNFAKIADGLNKKYKNNHQIFEKIGSFLPTLNMIAQNLDVEREIEFESVSMTLGDMETLALKFFSELDSELEEMVCSVLEDVQHTIINPQRNGDQERNSVGLNGNLVEIDLHPEKNTNGLVVVAHEFGHLLDERIQKRIAPKSDALQEVSAMVCEKLYSDWLLAKGYISKKDRASLHGLCKQNFVSDVKTIQREQDVLRAFGYPVTEHDVWVVGEILEKIGNGGKTLQVAEEIALGNRPLQSKRAIRNIVGSVLSDIVCKDFKNDAQQTIGRFKKFVKRSAFYNLNSLTGDGLSFGYATCMNDLLGGDFKSKISNFMLEKCSTKENT